MMQQRFNFFLYKTKDLIMVRLSINFLVNHLILENLNFFMIIAHNLLPRVNWHNNQPVYNEEFPYYVIMQILRSGSENICGGGLITQNRILSAAHCFAPHLGPISEIRVFLNHKNIFNRDQSYYRGKVLINPAYDEKTSRNDIAFVQLIQEIPITPFLLVTRTLMATNVTLTIPGMAGSTSIDPRIRVVKKTVLVNRINEAFIEATVIHDEGLSCELGSGSPVILKGLNAFQDVLVGIASNTSTECATSGLESYTSIFDHLSWIRENV